MMSFIFLVTLPSFSRLSSALSFREYTGTLDTPVGYLGTASGWRYHLSDNLMSKYNPRLNPVFNLTSPRLDIWLTLNPPVSPNSSLPLFSLSPKSSAMIIWHGATWLKRQKIHNKIIRLD